MKLSERIILALDVEDWKEAKYFLDILSPYVKIFKIGPRLFIPYAQRIVNLIQSYNCDVFLDLKLHDIPTQVGYSVREIAKMGIKMFTVHSLGGIAMIKEARRVLDSFKPSKRPLMLGVTVLTSLDGKDLQFLGFKNKINSIVFKLTKLALSAGADGVICSVKDLKFLRAKIKQDFITVVPGLKLGVSQDDQKRTGSPEEAFSKGADYIVLGRAILKAVQPVKVLREVLNEGRRDY